MNPYQQGKSFASRIISGIGKSAKNSTRMTLRDCIYRSGTPEYVGWHRGFDERMQRRNKRAANKLPAPTWIKQPEEELAAIGLPTDGMLGIGDVAHAFSSADYGGHLVAYRDGRIVLRWWPAETLFGDPVHEMLIPKELLREITDALTRLRRQITP